MHDGFIHVLVLLFLAHTGIAQQQGSLPAQLPQVDIEGIKFNDETCPPAEMTEQARNSTKEEIRSILRDTVVPTLDGITGRCPCGGPGLWRRIAHLNMSDPNQQCPSNWQLITFPVRGCGRSSSANNTCDSAVFPSNGVSYSRVCGRINAIQRGVPDAFHNSRLINSALLEDAYVGGVSITHGAAGSRGHLLLRSMKLALMRQIKIFALALTATLTGHIKFLYLLATVISVTPETVDQATAYPLLHRTQTILCGMAKDVVLLVPAANSTTLIGNMVSIGSSYICEGRAVRILGQ